MEIARYELRLVKSGVCEIDEAGDPTKAAAAIAAALHGAADREHLSVLYLDSRNFPIGVEIAAVGGFNECASAPREIFRGAIQRGAVGLVLAHNHPSGILQFSLADLKFCQRMRAAGNLLGVELHDFLVVGPEGACASMRSGEGMEELQAKADERRREALSELQVGGEA